MMQMTCVRALSAWKNALAEMQRGRKDMTPTYLQSEGKQRKVACQSGHAHVQHTNHAQPPSQRIQQCGRRSSVAQAAAHQAGRGIFPHPAAAMRTKSSQELGTNLPAPPQRVATAPPAAPTNALGRRKHDKAERRAGMRNWPWPCSRPGNTR